MTPAIDTERGALLNTLVAHGVQFVVIGGAGIQSHGRRYDTLEDRSHSRAAGPASG